ncbi:MAG: hypothetical protein KBT32_10940 [Bacteroidales bacterium]|nr:hypothetical protein [Candidatus Physcocola equi]
MKQPHCRHLLLLLITCAITAVISGCTPKIFRGMGKEGEQQITVFHLHPFTMKDGEASNYSLDIDIRGNAMSGILSVQPDSSKESMRIICNSVFGFTLFDFDLTPKGLIIYDCADQMRNRHLIRMLEKDFRILFFQNFESQTFTSKVYAQADKRAKGYRIKNKYGDFRYITDETAGVLKMIESDAKITQSDITFQYTADKHLDNVVINHPVLRVKAAISRLSD